MKYPAENLYRETTKNSTFPYKNIAVDIDGDGKLDPTTSGVGFLSNSVPFLAALSLAVITILVALS